MLFLRRTCLSLALPLAALAAPSLEEAWHQPPPEARIRAYWWWLNGNVDRAAITRDLEQMKAKGFGGALICDAGGAEQRGNGRVPAGPTYGSPEWNALLRHALVEGERLGLEMSLNIQSGWNLGGPRVPIEDAVKKLAMSEQVVDGGSRVDVALTVPAALGGYYRDLFVLAYPMKSGKGPSGGVSDWKQRAMEEKIKMTGPNAWFLTNSAPQTEVLVRKEEDRDGEEDTAVGDVVDLTANLTPDGRLQWDAPPGQWQVIRFGCTLGDEHKVSTHSDGWAGYAIDVFDRGAFERYWADSVAPVLDSVCAPGTRNPISSLRYLHTDSWEVDLINWTPTLREEFTRRRGYDLLPYLPALAGRIVNSRTTTNRFLNDFRKTLGDLAFDNHYIPFRELARRYGLGFHPESGGPHYTPIDAQRCLGLNDVPMSEFWAQSKTHRTTEDVRFFVKQPASAAHTYGKRFVAAEGFTSVGPHWQETLWDNLKPSFDHAVTEGLNRLVWHAFVCSPPAMGIPGQQYFAGTHLNPNVTWWEYSEPFFSYLNRVQAMMISGHFVADALYYYGDHVPNFAQSRVSDPAKLGAGYDYDVITEEAILERLTVRDGRLVLPDGMSYRVLVLPDRPEISLPVLRKVRALVHGGATVIGPRPTGAPSLTGQPAADAEVDRLAKELWDDRPSSVRGRVIADRTARDVLMADGIGPDFAVEPGSSDTVLGYIHRRDGDTEIYFVANRANAPAKADVSFRVPRGVPALWDPVRGTRAAAADVRHANGRTTLPLELPPYGSIVVVFRPRASGGEKTADRSRGRSLVQEIAGPWTVSFDPKWAGPAEPVTFETLISWTERPERQIKHYSGTATYRTTFTVHGEGSTKPAGGESETTQRRPDLDEVVLDLGMVRELAAVRLNGQSLGIVWAPPFRVQLGGALRPGANHLEIEVVNFWPNRIIGDAALPADQRVTRTNILNLKATTPLMPSGLFGPVRVLRSSGERTAEATSTGD